MSGKTVTVTMDGVQLLSAAVGSLPPAALLAFTAGTGQLTDIHTVRSVAITARSYAVPPPGPNGWVRNGSAVMSGTDLVLTPATQNQAGSDFQQTAVPSARLSAHFTARIGGGTGADGLAFVLLDAAKATAHSLGFAGGGLGYSGLPGVAVALRTWQNPGEPSNNFVAIADQGTRDRLHYLATATGVPNLRSGSHAIGVTVSAAGHLVVTVDGKQVLDTAVSLPPNVLVGFTGATGGATDVHTVNGVSISY